MLLEHFTRRLAFIKYVYNLGVKQSQQPEPLGAVSILTFHDSIELFLQLSSEHLDIGKQSPGFMEYWDILKQRMPGDGLTQKESMRRLNKSRVALKHNGTMPSKLDIEAFRASTTNFFEENTQLVFSVEFRDISLINLIKYNNVKLELEKASKLISEEKIREATTNIKIAFIHLMNTHYMNIQEIYGGAFLKFGEDMESYTSFLTDYKNAELSEFADHTIEAIGEISSALKIISLKINYQDYAKFNLFTPNINFSTTGKLLGIHHHSNSDNLAIDECRFCFDFVLESALIIQDLNLELDVLKKFI